MLGKFKSSSELYCATELKDCLAKGMFHLKTLQIHGITHFEMDELINYFNGDPRCTSMTFLVGKMKLEVVKIFLKQLKHLERLSIKVFAEKVSCIPNYRLHPRSIENWTRLLHAFKKGSSQVEILVSCEPVSQPHWSDYDSRWCKLQTG